MGRTRKKRQQSSIDLLPDDIRAQLNELLADRRVTQLEAVRRINAMLEDLRTRADLPDGTPERLSKSAVNRYALEMEEIGRELRESREIAEVWIGKLGAAPQGQVGSLVNEILRSLSFDLTRMLKRGGVDPENAPAVVGMLKDLALTTQRLEQAANLNVKREAEIRKQAAEAAADVTEKTLANQGMSRDSIEAIKREILGTA